MKTLKRSLFKSLGFILTLSTIFLMASITSCTSKPPKNSRAAQAAKGKVHFQKYCTSCHGENAKGVAIDSLGAQPADLTKITKRQRGDQFPILYVANTIDGRKMTKIHGNNRAMPIWGEVFREEEYLDESQIKGKLAEIIAYLMTIQKYD